MKILVDTNILISALLWPSSKPAFALLHVVTYHTLILTDINLTEFREVIKRKIPNVLPDAETFLEELSFEIIPSVTKSVKTIRDPKDQPILNAAIEAKVDIILTGDKDFLSLTCQHPQAMTAAEYCKKFAIRG